MTLNVKPTNCDGIVEHRESLLNIKDIEITFPSRKQDFIAVDSVSVHVNAGEIVGLVGESGAGKSTIGRAVISLLDKPGYVSGGVITFGGKDLAHLSDSEVLSVRGKKIASIFQDPLTSLNPVLRISTQMVETLVGNLGLSKSQARERAVELLRQVEIPSPETSIDKYPHELSGGQRQRVVIAIALSCEPDLIIADEPTTALDVTVQKGILQTLRNLCRENNIAVILVTHDMGVIADTTDRLYILRLGKLVEQGATKDVLANPKNDYTKSLIASIPPLDKKIDRFPVLDTYYSQESPEQKKATAFLKEAVNDIWDNSKPILQVDSVTKYYGSKGSLLRADTLFKAVSNVNFEIMPGTTLGLVGESGSGKSTIGRMIAGLLDITEGTVKYKGVDITDKSDKELVLKNRLELQVIFQDPFSSLNSRMTVGQILSEALEVHKIVPDVQERKDIVIGLLHRVGLRTEDYKRYPHQFSGGQRQRIGIARALSVRPRFIFCDEPTSALDVSIQAQVLNLLKDLQQELNLTMLFVSHDLAVVRQMSDRVAVMRNGEICELNDGEQVFTNPQHDYTKILLESAPGQGNIV